MDDLICGPGNNPMMECSKCGHRYHPSVEIHQCAQTQVPKIRGYVVRCDHGKVWAGTTIEELRATIEQVACIGELEVGEDIGILVVERTQQQIDALRDI